jgi:hypothetical protein
VGPVVTRTAAEPEAGTAPARSSDQPLRDLVASAEGAARVLALQRAAGNAAVVRQLQPRPQPWGVARSPLERDADAERRGSRALRESAAGRRSLARYAHADCAEADLKAHIWPSDHIAREMVKKSIKALSADPVDPGVRELLARYFMTRTPSLRGILKVFDKLDAEFRANDYTYECEDVDENDRCKSVPDSSRMAKAAHGYTWGGILGALTGSHIHLCMNTVRDKDNVCVASTIVHEMSHRYAGTDDNAYCNFCDDADCPKELSAEDALENADSFSAFAYKLWPTSIT